MVIVGIIILALGFLVGVGNMAYSWNYYSPTSDMFKRHGVAMIITFIGFVIAALGIALRV